jgi:hypothetical protein
MVWSVLRDDSEHGECENVPPVILAVGAIIQSSGFVAQAVGFAINMGVNLAISAVTKLFVGSPKAPSFGQSAFNNQVTVRQPIMPWRIVYGRARIGGGVTYIEQTGSNKEYVHLIITLAGHEVEAIPKVYIDNVEVPLDGSGDATGTYAGYFHCEMKLGTSGQTAYTNLISASAGAYTSNHRQRGRANAYVKLKLDSTKFPNGIPNITFDVKGKKLYDPRTATTVYSENAVLAIRDYLTDTSYGLGVDSSEINDDLLEVEADTCDENVNLLAGGTEDRYTCNGSFLSSETAAQVLPRMLSACGGRLTYSGGKFGIYAGSYRTADSTTITQSELRHPLKGVRTRRSRRDLFNVVKGVFIDPNNGWKPTDFPPVARGKYLAEDNGYNTIQEKGFWATATAYIVGDALMNDGQGYICYTAHTSDAAKEPGTGANWADYWYLLDERIIKDVEFPFTISAATAQRLSLIDLNRNRRQISLTLPGMLKLLRHQPPATVALTIARYGWTAKAFEVASCQFAQEEDTEGAPVLGVDLGLEETDADVFAWSTADELAQSTPATSLVKPDTSFVGGVPQSNVPDVIINSSGTGNLRGTKFAASNPGRKAAAEIILSGGTGTSGAGSYVSVASATINVPPGVNSMTFELTVAQSGSSGVNSLSGGNNLRVTIGAAAAERSGNGSLTVSGLTAGEQTATLYIKTTGGTRDSVDAQATIDRYTPFASGSIA